MEKEKSNEKDLNYPLKLWVLTLFITTVLYSLCCVYNADWNGSWSKALAFYLG